MGYILVETKDIKQLSQYKHNPIYQDFNILNIFEHEADMHLLVLKNDNPTARASIWWENTPKIEDLNVGTIGHFSANDEESAKFLLDKACEILRKHSVITIIAPMNGNTWRSYRFITNRGNEPDFFLEPDNPDIYPDYFLEAGFYPIEEYISAINYDLSARDPRTLDTEEKIKEQKITIRKIDIDRFEEELNIIYEISLEGFKDNVLYTPMSREDFFKQYLPLKDLIIPEFVLIAQDKDKKPIGFVFALPNINQLKRGEKIDTVILKTLAIIPEKRSGGLGSLLINKVRETAYEMDYKKAVYALIHKANKSRNIAEHFGETIRTYTLYERKA
ncbi:MAG: GNAT family N-acetyltransferase [Ignavibacteriales bacterium]